jgi:hypothetical protein
VEQLPRLLAGGSGGPTRPGLVAGLVSQGRSALAAFGWPALVLAVVGRPRPGGDGLDRTLAAVWAAGAVLAAVASASPFEVRYLYALSAPLAVAAGVGFVASARGFGWRALAATALAGAQAAVGLGNLAEALLRRYRG